MIKKFTLLLLAMLCIAGTMTAKIKVLELTPDGNGIISKENFTSSSAGDIITFSHSVNDGTHFKVFYKTGEGGDWSYKKFSDVAYNSEAAGDTYTPWINYGSTYTITITVSNLEQLKNYGLWLEDYAGIDDITRSTNIEPTETVVSWSGSVALNWGNSAVDAEELGSGNMSKSKLLDVIKITYESATSGNNIWIVNRNGWAALDDSGSGQFSNVAEGNGTVEYEITNVIILEKIQQNGIVVSGVNATVTKVELLTFTDSYDAVSITIGEDEIATYSNSTKNVQISACDGVRAYYASAVSSGEVTLTEFTGCIPANTGVIVKGSQGTYTVPVGSDGWPGDVTNYLKPTGDNSQNVARSVKGTYHYIFAKDNTNGEIGFYKLAEDYSRVTTEKEGDIESGTTVYYHRLAAHKAYLETDTDYAPTDLSSSQQSVGSKALIRLSFGGGGGTTAINTALKNPIVEDGLYYTLQGVAVKNPSKGIYILNGKKVFVK